MNPTNPAAATAATSAASPAASQPGTVPAPATTPAILDNSVEQDLGLEIDALMGGGSEPAETTQGTESAETADAGEAGAGEAIEPAAEGEAEGEAGEPEGAETEAAAETPAVETAPAAEAAAQPGAEEATEAPAAVTATAAAAAMPTAAEAQAVQQAVTAFGHKQAAHQQAWAAMQKQIADKTYDPMDDAGELARLQMERQELAEQRPALERQVQDFQQRQAAGEWAQWGQQHPLVGMKDARAQWDAQIDRFSRQGLGGPRLEGAVYAAFQEWVGRVETAKRAAGRPAAGAPNKAAANKQAAAGGANGKTVTRGAAQVTPRTVARVPQPRALSVDEKIEQGKYGNLAALV